MANPQNPRISSRKQPQQARSAELVSAILTAATQVLAKEGATRFTTARVAEKAGVSIGSLYQYFPNKAAILFRLQSDEWQQTTDLLRSILESNQKPPMERLRILVHSFIQSECEEADMRTALNDAAPLYRAAPEAQQAKATGQEIFHRFMQEVLPNASAETRATAANLITTTLSNVGKNFSDTTRTSGDIKEFSNAMADMFCAYLTSIQQQSTC